MLGSEKDTHVILGLLEFPMLSIIHSAPLVKPSVTSLLVVKSHFAVVALWTSEYKLIVLVGSSGTFALICFLRSSEISPVTMSTALICPLLVFIEIHILLLWELTDTFIVNR